MTMTWYVLRSKPNKEEFLWRQVLAHQVDVFYPAIRAKVVNPRARKTKPYFPGYMFVHVDIETVPLSLWLWLPGSRGLVFFDEEPAAVPESLVAAIRRKVEEINLAAAVLPNAFTPGDRIVVHSGPFAEYDGIFDGCISGNDRVRVLLRLLKDKYIPLELPAEQVERKKQSV